MNIELTDSERQYLIELIDNNLEQCIRYDEDTEVSMLEGLLRKLGVDVD